jgi:hypothetical protein
MAPGGQFDIRSGPDYAPDDDIVNQTWQPPKIAAVN